MDDEYAKLVRRMNAPRVVIDNDSCQDATIIRVDSVNKHGILLEVVQVITDLNLVITKAFISSDGGWFMGVFNVIDRDGNKIRDKKIINHIQQTLESHDSLFLCSRETAGSVPSVQYTSIELTGVDRPGLLSEVCAVFTDHHCNVVNAEIWTHNGRAAAVVHVTDSLTGCAIEDPKHLSILQELLCNVLKGNNDLKSAKLRISPAGGTHRERRLHQIMLADLDSVKAKRMENRELENKRLRPRGTVLDCSEKDYSIITMRSKDRPKLLFDIICTLTDMQYVIFHGVVRTEEMEAYQEFYIRHVDGYFEMSETEKERVVHCLEAAMERRASEGLELELCAEDRVGLLTDITRTFRENALWIRRAEISTEGGKANDTFYVTDVSGSSVDPETIDLICHRIELSILHVKENPKLSGEPPEESTISHLFGNFFKARSNAMQRVLMTFEGGFNGQAWDNDIGSLREARGLVLCQNSATGTPPPKVHAIPVNYDRLPVRTEKAILHWNTSTITPSRSSSNYEKSFIFPDFSI